MATNKLTNSTYATEQQSLVLPSLVVENYRLFERLSLPKLARVNLIAGKNNVGKSCLLEALRIYANRGAAAVLEDILSQRDELSLNRFAASIDNASVVSNLFHDRRYYGEDSIPIRIGPLQANSANVQLSIELFTEQRNEEGLRTLQPIERPSSFPLDSSARDIIPALVRKIGAAKRQITRLERLFQTRSNAYEETIDIIPNVFVSAHGLDERQVVQLWEQTRLLDPEQDVIRSMQIITPEIAAVDIIGRAERIGRQTVIVRLTSGDDRLPLRSLGEGISRLFGLALALVNAKGGLLLVDEIESGLHYSVQFEMWRFVIAVAKELNVQVFATTHSNDCISTFQRALSEHSETDGAYLRLEKKGGKIRAVVFERDELAIADREDIEIR